MATNITEGARQSPPGFKRVLSFWDLMFYGIVIIQPTAPLPSFGIVNSVSRGHAVSAILLAMVAMMLTAFSYGKMARAYPTAGSAYTFVGRELHPNLGLLTGWSIALDYVLNPTIGVIWCSKAAINIVPLPFIVWAAFFAVAFGFVNLMGIRMNARTNTVLTISMFTVLIVFFVAAASYLFHIGGVSEFFSSLPFYNPSTFAWNRLRAGTSIAVLTYMGFDSISTLSEDVKNPQRNIMLATVSLCLFTGVLGGFEVYVGQLIWPDFTTYPDLDTAFVSVAGRAAGPWMFYTMNFTLLIATVGSSIGAQLGAVVVEPTQPPSVQVPVAHVHGVPHTPSRPHVSTASPEHCVAPPSQLSANVHWGGVLWGRVHARRVAVTAGFRGLRVAAVAAGFHGLRVASVASGFRGFGVAAVSVRAGARA